MDMDTSYSLRNQKQYYKLYNGTLTIDEELGTGTVSNVDGNVYSFEIPESVTDPSNKDLGLAREQRIIGAGVVDQWIILFSTDNTHKLGIIEDDNNPGGEVPIQILDFPPYDQRGIGIIWAFQYDESTGEVLHIDLTTEPGKKLLNPDKHIIFFDRLGFFVDRPVKMIGSSESKDVRKAYFTDFYNNLRYINLMEEDILNQPLEVLELIQNVSFVQPLANIVSGGTFMPGVVQYSYQMYGFRGGETKFSPASPLINIAHASYNSSDTSDFKGSEYVDPYMSASTTDVQENETGDAQITKGEPTDKACRVRIENLDTNFAQLRIVRIFYDTNYGTPQIDIVAELKIESSGKVSFHDDGKVTMGSLTHQEFEAMGGVLFTARDITVSNNRLIAGNIQEYYYNPDYDARAYRFSDTGDAQIIKSNEEFPDDNYILIDNLGNWVEYTNGTPGGTSSDWSISYEYDSVNKDPNVFNQTILPSVLGGTGKNIEYTFKVKSITIDSNQMTEDAQADTISNNMRPDEERTYLVNLEDKDYQNWEDEFGEGFVNNKGYTNYSSEINSSNVVGYQRDETYRFGIIFFDIKGRQTFVYWIGDIKMPNIQEEKITAVNSPGSEIFQTDARILYPEFKINNYPEDSVSYQIVRVPREESDRTVVANGIITPCAKGGEENEDVYQPTGGLLRQLILGYNDDDTPSVSTSDFLYSLFSKSWNNLWGTTEVWQYQSGINDNRNITYNDNLFTFWSPEISFYKSVPISDLKIVFNGKIGGAYSAEFANEYEPGKCNRPTDLFYKGMDVQTVIPVELDIANSIVITKETKSKQYTIGGIDYRHSYAHSYDFGGTRSIKGQAGAGFIGKVDSSISAIVPDKTDYTIAYGMLKRNIVQYGGDSFDQRKANRYTKASVLKRIDTVNTNEVACFGGDTYITMFEHLRFYNYESERKMDWDWDGAAKKNNRSKGYIQTVVFPVETTINVDWRTDTPYTRYGSGREAMREYKGSNEADSIICEQSDLYTSNYTYIRLNDIALFQEEPKFFEELVTELSHRLMASDPKYDGEVSDSWLKFKPMNILDVDGINGPINAIQAISGHLYFFQRQGIGMTRIDERALVNDTEGISLVLGTGDIFGKPQYISQEEGVISPFSVIKGRTGVYFYDYISKTICVVGQNGTTDLARLKGVRSYVKNKSKDYLEEGDVDGVVTGFDYTSGQVYFTFKEADPGTNYFTLMYDETIGDFISFYDFKPRLYVSSYSRFITVDDANKKAGWIHNIGEKGSFYGDSWETILTTFISDKPQITKIFDSIEYVHDADEDLLIGNPPVPAQTFSKIRCYNNLLDTGQELINSKFRFRTWRAKLPRYDDPKTGRQTRLGGKYLKMDLIFDNSNNHPLYLQPLLTHWRPVAFIEP